jgi:DNA ligase-1
MVSKNSRPSPSESATLFPVGTKKVGNDNFMYKVILTSNNTKRWVKDKESTNTSTKKRVSKKRSVKRSTKKRVSKKRVSKKRVSKKRVSKKRSVKRSIKKRSTKKRTSTKKRVSKKRSVKRSTKKRVSKKRTSDKKRSDKRSASTSTKKKSPRSSSKSRSNNKPNINIPTPKKFNKNTFGTMLAHKYNGQDPTGYYISEKLDGIRAIYDPTSDSFMSRNNKPFFAPKSFTEKFPKDLVLDGELYTKRKDFAGTGIFRKKIPIESEWKKATFMVFDMPLVHLPFSERYTLMKKLLKGIPHLQVVEHTIIKDLKHMDTVHKNLVKLGAEGTMLRHPDSYYENKRSHHLLKVKDFFDDEAIVEGMEFGEGRNSEVMGNLIVKWAPQAKQKYKGTFEVGSGFNDEQRKNWKKLYPKGTVITIKYWEINESGKPRFPIFLNIRHKE